MKHIKHWLITAAVLLYSVTMNATEFEVDGIYYRFTSGMMVELVYGGNCTGKVVIPDKVSYDNEVFTVTSIGDEAFNACKNITSVTIPKGITNIGFWAFADCTNLTSVTIGQGVTNIGQGAFGGCHNLTSVTLDEGVEKIEAIAFSDCKKLTSIVLPTSVSSIGEAAFSACSSLTSIVIPGGVMSLGNQVLADCGSLTSITVDANNAVYDSRNNCNAIIRKDNDELIAGCSTTIIPTDVMSIGYGAFAGCSGLTSVTFPENMVNIGDQAFRDCGNLTSVTISECITNIGAMAFSNCRNLSTVVSKATSSPRLGSSPFSNISSSSILFVPEGSVPSYESAGWNNYFASIEEIETEVLATSLTLDVTTASLAPDETLTLNATLLPADVTETTLSWTSSNEAVATVDANGVVTAVADGEATITVSTKDGSNLSATCVVTVETEEVGGEEEVDTENFLSMEDLSVRAGSQIELSVNMNNVVDITNFQFDLVLPEGITIALDEDGYECINVSTERTTTTKHNYINWNVQPDGSMRVVCSSNSNAVFSGTEGEVMTITLNVSASLSEGQYTAQIKNVVLTEKTAESYISHYPISTESTIHVFTYTLGDVNGDEAINVTDISGIVNLILNIPTDGLIEQAADVNEDGAINVTDISGVVNLILNVTTAQTSLARSAMRAPATRSAEEIRLTTLPFTLKAGEEKEIYVLLDNPGDAFTGIQFDLYLPEGINIPVDEYGRYSVDLGSRATSLHNIPACNMQSDGVLRVVCHANNNATFKGEEGDVLVITVVGEEGLPDGVYNVELNNIVLSRPNVTQDDPNNYTASVLVGDGGAEQELSLNGIYTADVLSDFSDALATNDKITSIDLSEAVSVAGEGTLTTGNPNTLIYLAEGATLANESNIVCGDECANLQLTDGYAFSVSGLEAAQASYVRTLNGTLWNALYMPFNIPVSAFGEGYDVAYISKVEESADGLVMLIETITEGSLEANTPYFVRAKDSNNTELTIKVNGTTPCETVEKAVNYTAGTTTLQVIGNYSTMTSTELSGCYAISTQGMWQPAKDGAVLRSFRTYLKMTGAPARAIRIHAVGEATDIESDAAMSAPDNSPFIYDLQGRRVENPTKGIYIVNGEKVLY